MHVRTPRIRAVRSLALPLVTAAAVLVPPTVASAGSAAVAAPDAVVILGDSYSSGLGSGNYYNDCDNTPNAWGNLIFPATVTSRTLLACSGAAIPEVQGQVAELAGLPSSGNRLVTVTVGGNDVGFADELEGCYFSDCTGRRGIIEDRIDGLVGPLTDLYDDIQAAAPGDRVIVGGYPLLVPDPDVRGWCYALTFLITSAERDMIRALGVRLNDVIDQAAAQAGVTAVTTDLENRFTGHEACRNADRDWLWGLSLSGAAGPQGEVLASYYDPRSGIEGDFVRDSFHPRVKGQRAYAAAFEAAHGLNPPPLV